MPDAAVVRAADPLQERGDAARRADLAHELDRADVDAELERRGGDERLQLAGAQPALDPVAAVLRQAARGARRRTSSPSRSPSWCASRSASRRVFTNTSVVWCCSTSSAIWSSTSPICSADVTASSSPSGSSSARSRSRWWPASTIAGRGRSPTSSRATVSIGRWVADSPMRCGTGVAQRLEPFEGEREVRAALVARDGVDLVDDHRLGRAQQRPTLALVTSRNSDSGVVTTKLGGWRSIAARSELVVSPVRTATRMSGAASPSSAATVGDLARAGARGSRRCRRPAPSAATRRRPG